MKTRLALAAALGAVVAACAAPPPPPPPVVVAPPPPPKIVIPPRPTPPAGAFATMAVPQLTPDGRRLTVNHGITPEQKLWNVRSGLNVAALNCLQPEHATLVDNYRAFLKRHSRELARTNRELAAQYRKEHGRGFRAAQDAYMTKVYNYFALPPVLPQFCDVAHQVSHEVVQVEPGELESFSETALARLEAVFHNFFAAYEKYRVDLAAWDARYGNGGVHTLEANYRQASSSTQPPETN